MNMPLLDRWLDLAVETIVRSLALFALTALAALVLRRASAATHTLLWRLTFAALLALPLLTVVLPPLPVPVLDRVPLRRTLPAVPPASVRLLGTPLAPEQEVTTSNVPVVAMVQSVRVNPSIVTSPTVFAPLKHAASAKGIASSPFTRNLPLLLFTMWVTGALIVLCRLIMGLFALRRLQSHTEPADSAVLAAVGTLCPALSMDRNVRVRVTAAESAVAAPMTWGVLRPVLLLPVGVESWPSERLRAVLLHELAHISRRDWLTRLLSDIACACYWFHPLVWLAARRLRRDTELACDDSVLAWGVRPSDYAAHLLEIVRLHKATGAFSTSAISMAQPSLLEARLQSLFDARRSRNAPSRMAISALVVFLILPTLPLAAARIMPAHTTIGDKQSAKHSAVQATISEAMDRPHGNVALVEGPQVAPLPPDTIPPFTQPQTHVLGIGASMAKRRPAPMRVALPLGEALPDRSARVAAWRKIVIDEVSPAKPQEKHEIVKMDLNGVEWGAVTDGLQAGIRISNTQRRFAVGQRVPMECYLRNITDHDIALSYAMRVYMEERPQVRDARPSKGNRQIQGALLTGLDSALVLVLRPGDTLVLWHPGIVLGNQPERKPEPGQQKTGLEQWPYLEEPIPGDYLIKQTVRYQKMTAEQVQHFKELVQKTNAVLAEPYEVTLTHPDGKTERVNATLIPFNDEPTVLVTGEARFTILPGAKANVASPTEHVTATGAATNPPNTDGTDAP
jgi:beta-lactamase regulating signal transducer with metallopeptidase domain